MARLPSGPREPDEPDDDISSLFGDADDDIDVDDDPDAYEPAFPPVAAPAPPPRPSLPDPREAPPTYDIPELSMQVPPRPDATPRGPSTAIPADGGAFFWGLTPNDDPDPLVHGDQPDVAGTPPAEDEQHHRHGLVPPTVPLAPYVPFVYDEPVPGEPPIEAVSESEPGHGGPAHGDAGRGDAAHGDAAHGELSRGEAGHDEPALPGPAHVEPPTTHVPREPVQPVPPVVPSAVPPVVPPAPDAIAVPSWSDLPDPRHPSLPVEPPATPPAQTESPVAEPPGVEPDAGHGLPPGTVELPWLRRSHRSERRQDEGATSGAPSVPGEDPTSAMPGVPSPPSQPAATERDETPPDSRSSSSWSLFGDLFDDERESQQDDAAGQDGASAGSADAQQPRAGAGHSVADDLPTTDIFAAFNAAAAAAGLPGVDASEAAAYDIPEPRTPEPAVPWDDPTGATNPGIAGPGTAGPATPERGATGPTRSGDAGRGGYGAAGSGPGGTGSGRGRGHDSHDSDDGGPSPRAQRIMLIIAGALLLVLLLIALFIVGRAVAHPDAAVTPTPTKTVTPTPTPTPTVAAKGPVAPGKHPWNALLGGECLQPFTTPWADTFTVVACTTPHAGQLVYTGLITADAAAAFPGSDQLASQVGALCTRAGIVNLAAAGKYGDAQIQTSYPVTETQWKQGKRSYYCFVNRASGQPITGSLAGPGPK